jgi:hypothetical protein
VTRSRSSRKAQVRFGLAWGSSRSSLRSWTPTGGSREFWDAPEEVQQNVDNVFAQTRAKLVVTSCPACPPRSPTGRAKGRQHIEGTPYCVRPLQPSQ